MPTFRPPTEPPTGTLLRLLLVLVAGFLLVQFGPGAMAGRTSLAVEPPDGPAPGPGRVLPVATTTLSAPGPGLMVPPHGVDDVDASAFGWALLDRRAGTVLVLGIDGEPVRTVGRRGAGPGELERPLRVALGPDGGVAVLDATGQRLDLLPRDRLPVRVPIPGEGCRGTFGDDVQEHGGAWWILRRCYEGASSDVEVWRIVDGRSAERVERRTLTSLDSDPFRLPLLVADRQRLFLGDNRDACLGELGGGKRLCLPRTPRRPIPDSVTTRLFGDLERRAAAVGLDFRVPRDYPGLVGARPAGGDVAVRILMGDRADAWAVERGDSLIAVVGDADARAEPGVGRWLLIREDLQGLRIWVRPPP